MKDAPRGAGLTLVDGVLRQLAQLAAHDPRIGAQEFLLTGGQLQGESAVRGARACPPKAPHLLPPSTSPPALPSVMVTSAPVLQTRSLKFTRLLLTLYLDPCLLCVGQG